MNTEITLLKWPGEEDWMFSKSCALVTIGKHSGKAPDMEWKHKMLRAKHSPIRTLNFAFYLHNVPYYVSTHLARHVHSVPFIKSQRNDRQSDYDRNAARQDAPVPSMSDSFRFVLAQLYAASEVGTPMGRDKLLQKARESHVPLSQQEVRTILSDMAGQGLARVSRGRGGSQLTPKGRELWEIGQR